MIDATDRRIIDALQGGFPLTERPYADAAAALGIEEAELLSRLERLLAEGVLSRFGPLYNAERLGGAVTLAAMAVPRERFEEVAALVNAHPEVAHNYERDDALNMWFVVA
ncbi:MAG: AsnC family transcriptional regulator, partial [Rhodospirillales bacterium]|nr:AsnC family transcriptional regulator [Rhodospirillales bacterium]